MYKEFVRDLGDERSKYQFYDVQHKKYAFDSINPHPKVVEEWGEDAKEMVENDHKMLVDESEIANLRKTEWKDEEDIVIDDLLDCLRENQILSIQHRSDWKRLIKQARLTLPLYTMCENKLTRYPE